jgi:hypothetical protein
MPRNIRILLCGLFFAALLGALREATVATTVSSAPHYARDGGLAFPESYRTWTFLTSGFDMSYSASMQMDHHMFDNVFVNPESYADFVRTGTWPDKTMLVLEVRAGQNKGSINKSGAFQREVMGVEVHVRDDARFPGRWAFFAFGPGDRTGTMLPPAASCYACHSHHAAVDTTFVQFYPTLLPIAERDGTLSPGYRSERREAASQ